MSYPMFDRSRLHLKPLAERIHDMKLAEVLPLDAPAPAFDDPALPADRRADRPGARETARR